MRTLEIPRLLGRRASRERDLALIASRVIAPCSKLSTLRGLRKVATKWTLIALACNCRRIRRP